MGENRKKWEKKAENKPRIAQILPTLTPGHLAYQVVHLLALFNERDTVGSVAKVFDGETVDPESRRQQIADGEAASVN
jgi:hypothetical protein